jgi:polyferredoxin
MRRGLKLFPDRSSARHRRRRLIFLAIYGALFASLIWPVYPLFAGARPLVLGLPLSLAWIVLVLSLMFAALLWLFFGEEPRGES